MKQWEFSFYKSTWQVTYENFLIDGWFWWHQSLLASNHFLPPSLLSLSFHLHQDCWLDWLSVSQCWTLVFNILFTDFGVSNNIPLTMIYCAWPVTLKFGLRTIPFGYFHSADWAQSYSASLDPLVLLKYIFVASLGWVEFFCFFICCLTLPFHLLVLIACILTNDMVMKK